MMPSCVNVFEYIFKYPFSIPLYSVVTISMHSLRFQLVFPLAFLCGCPRICLIQQSFPPQSAALSPRRVPRRGPRGAPRPRAQAPCRSSAPLRARSLLNIGMQVKYASWCMVSRIHLTLTPQAREGGSNLHRFSCSSPPH